MKHWASTVPLTKLKIIVVIWQFLTVFPSFSSVDFPPFYSRFLSVIDFVNFDLGAIVSASSIFPGVSFYHSLLFTTLGSLALALVLGLTFQIAKHRAGTAGVVAKRTSRVYARCLLPPWGIHSTRPFHRGLLSVRQCVEMYCCIDATIHAALDSGLHVDVPMMVSKTFVCEEGVV